LHRLDKYITETLIPVYTKGKRRKKNHAYFNLLACAYRLRKEGKYVEAKQWRKKAQTMPAYDPDDPDYRRFKYCRYADDILLGFVGSRYAGNTNNDKDRMRLTSVMLLPSSRRQRRVRTNNFVVMMVDSFYSGAR